jgi:hypothetical protein
MPNTLITPTEVLRKILMVLHQKLNFVGRVYRDAESRFGVEGAKIGDTILLRLPNEYPSGSGATITPADTVESTVSLVVNNQKWVAPNFTSAELTLSMDQLTERVVEPAASKLAALLEADCFSMTKDVYFQVGTAGTTPNTLLPYLQAHAIVSDNLAPTSKRCFHIKPLDNATLVDALKGLFQDSATVAEQYREGVMGRTAGGDWYENTLIDRITNGDTVTSVTVSGAGQTGATVLLGGVANTNTFKKGQVFTMAGCNRVHPETKVDTGVLQQFTITANTTATTTTVTIPISPSIVVTGAKQNVSASPTASGAVVFMGAANLVYGANLHFYKDAFAVATVDMFLPKGTDMAARETMDGISLRLLRDYAVGTDILQTRLDVLYGYKTIRPQLACRVASS